MGDGTGQEERGETRRQSGEVVRLVRRYKPAPLAGAETFNDDLLQQVEQPHPAGAVGARHHVSEAPSRVALQLLKQPSQRQTHRHAFLAGSVTAAKL